MNINLIAMIAHEINRAYCKAIGDNSQPTWDKAPDWQKQSDISGVKFHLDNPDVKTEQSHAEWLRVKQQAGWKYGPVKNPDTKEHPCFRPYEQLPVEQRTKDILFGAVVDTLKGLDLGAGVTSPATDSAGALEKLKEHAKAWGIELSDDVHELVDGVRQHVEGLIKRAELVIKTDTESAPATPESSAQTQPAGSAPAPGPDPTKTETTASAGEGSAST